MGKIVTVDFDGYKGRIDKAKKCLNEFINIPGRCEVRISPSGEGLHIRKYCWDEENHNKALVLKEKWDDSERLEIDYIRKKYGFTSDILFDIKCINGERRVASKWFVLKDKSDVEKFTEGLK